LTEEGIGGVRGESRWPPALTLLVAIVVPLLLPDRFSLTPKWIGPALLTALLVAHIIADPGRIDRQSRAIRAIGIGLVAVLVAGAATQAVVLIVELVSGNKALNSADALLSSGALVWLNTIIAFTFLYWEFDGGGPVARAQRGAEYPHLAFPQHMNPDLAPPDWRPLFPDYLYLGLTNATAFSPTDVMPLRHWAKLTMGAQALISLIILGLVIARAVNILS
jgi:branched-subunit amino acid transport protein